MLGQYSNQAVNLWTSGSRPCCTLESPRRLWQRGQLGSKIYDSLLTWLGSGLPAKDEFSQFSAHSNAAIARAQPTEMRVGVVCMASTSWPIGLLSGRPPSADELLKPRWPWKPRADDDGAALSWVPDDCVEHNHPRAEWTVLRLQSFPALRL